MSKIEQFIKIIKSEFPDDRITYQKAIATFHPQSAEEASNFFKLSNLQRQQVFITGFGNNIDPVGKPFSEMITIRTDRLNKVTETSPDDLYITTGSGYPLKEINNHLKRENLWLPHSSLPYVGSVGGSIAVGLNATFGGHDFPLKKYFIKAEIVTPEGDIITPGSTCFKSVSGYDIVKIFSGSWGLLGLIVSSTFRVMPITATEEFSSMTLNSISRQPLLDALVDSNETTDAIYSRKVKLKFDPNNILPVV